MNTYRVYDSAGEDITPTRAELAAEQFPRPRTSDRMDGPPPWDGIRVRGTLQSP